MAILYISEFRGPSSIGTARVAPLPQPALADQAVTFTTTTQSAAFNVNTHIVSLCSDTVCHIVFGDNPTATTTNFLLPASTIVSFSVIPGQKVAAVTP